jgi:hypothetical protein
LLLIGLGGPFWHDTVDLLTGIRHIARGQQALPIQPPP